MWSFIPNLLHKCIHNSMISVQWLASNSCSLWYFAYNSFLSSSSKMFSEISSIRKEFSLTLQSRIFRGITPNAVPSTFLLHQFCNTDHKTFSFFFFYVQQRFPDCMLSLHSTWRANHHENAAKQKIQTLWEHQIVSCPRSRFSRSRRNCGSDRWWASCHYPRKWSVELLGLINCVCVWLGQVAKLRDASAELHVSCASKTGKLRQHLVDVGVSKVVVGSGLEVTGQ